MSVCRPARCLFARASTTLPAASSTTAVQARAFHASPAHSKKRRPHYPSIKAADMEQLQKLAVQRYPKYTSEEKDLLKAKYTAGQYAAIEAAEAAIDARDLLTQSRSRDGDPMALKYTADELRRLQPVLDKKASAPLDPYASYDVRPKTDDEMAQALAMYYVDEGERLEAASGGEAPNSAEDEEAARVRFLRFLDDPRTFMHADSEAGYRALSDEALTVLAPEMPKIDGVVAPRGGSDGDDPQRKRLMQQTGLSGFQLRSLRVKVLHDHRVVNQTRLGKVQSYYYLCIAGDGNGMLGVGEGKSTESTEGRQQSIFSAIRNMRPVTRYENRTIYGEVEGKCGAVELRLSARQPGFGLRCQSLIHEMARAAGIHDLSAKVLRSRNKMNTVKAAWQALLNQRLPEDIARARGRKLVDVRKVYYGGKVN
ncbi:uncharacterized protein K452DRAFT_349226 [Aplosporella prunicola CBS 121167]|uniref:Small ribosomal subunit protein uS5m n=1 Tax=Aplosporella prunicola CBS 121167 TaxID=1176127 RepID=A0A6A6BRF5_9PEZI|nr:uncharacterized protein K452DRAFT_349226 [Aplosporella prunicola CBS 121167]KAF2145814.1 hypothetical protein K452DRAFT_349226 [Aplosporella prunicola CBS 121167]